MLCFYQAKETEDDSDAVMEGKRGGEQEGGITVTNVSKLDEDLKVDVDAGRGEGLRETTGQ